MLICAVSIFDRVILQMSCQMEMHRTWSSLRLIRWLFKEFVLISSQICLMGLTDYRHSNTDRVQTWFLVHVKSDIMILFFPVKQLLEIVNNSCGHLQFARLFFCECFNAAVWHSVTFCLNEPCTIQTKEELYGTFFFCGEVFHSD